MRNRTHILEEESLFELKKILPNEWVVREKPKDYGIDVEIEIFSSEGNYTGLVFWVQLKGTDSTKNKNHKSIRMPIIKIRQLASYNLPVALFRYNSINKEFYFEWIIRYGYLSSSSNNKTFNIQFEDHHLWSVESIKHIISFLKKNNRFSNGTFTFPIKGFVNNINAPIKTSRILSGKISKDSSLINIVRDRYLADIEINLLENRTVLNLSGSYGSSIGYKKADNNDENLIYDAFKRSLLLLLSQTDKDVELFEFINDNKLLKDVIHHPGMLRYLLPKLLTIKTSNHFTEEIVDYVFKSGDPITKTAIQTIILLSSKNAISQERVESYFNQVISLCLESNNLISLATSYYNFGNYYKGIGVFNKALKYYNKAFKIEGSYIKRGYFCRELAGVLFELQFFRLSAKLYDIARKLEPENIFLIATLADAEMYSGNYEKALNLFDDFLTKNINSNHDKYEFSLKFTMLKAIVESLEIKTQKRNIIAPFNTLNLYSKKQLQDLKKLDKLINIDALNPIVWSQYSLLYIKKQDLTMVFISSLMQAVIIKFDPKIWAYLSILTTYDGAPSDLLNDIANTAYFYCREGYFSVLQEMVELEEFDGFRGDDFLSYVESLVKDPKEYPTELRFWNEGDLKIIEI